MRYNLNKNNSSKSERILYEAIKQLQLPFRHRWLVQNKEVDFIIANIAIEINGHSQSSNRNKLLVDAGYTPIHFTNKYIQDNRSQLKNILTNLIYGKC